MATGAENKEKKISIFRKIIAGGGLASLFDPSPDSGKGQRTIGEIEKQIPKVDRKGNPIK